LMKLFCLVLSWNPVKISLQFEFSAGFMHSFQKREILRMLALIWFN
jgi:hypothetical protein